MVKQMTRKRYKAHVMQLRVINNTFDNVIQFLLWNFTATLSKTVIYNAYVRVFSLFVWFSVLRITLLSVKKSKYFEKNFSIIILLVFVYLF